MGKSSLTPEELQTVTKSDTPCLIMTAIGKVETNEEATVYIKDSDTFLCVCVKLVDDSLAVLSLGMLCETMGWSFSGKQDNTQL